MVRHVAVRYPTTKIICIGFSMGGNIVTKYLGERPSIPQIIAGISACQVIFAVSYDIPARIRDNIRHLTKVLPPKKAFLIS